jgi:hypothetical protein
MNSTKPVFSEYGEECKCCGKVIHKLYPLLGTFVGKDCYENIRTYRLTTDKSQLKDYYSFTDRRIEQIKTFLGA